MPFVIGGARKGGRVLGAALGLTLLCAGSAQAAGASNPLKCAPEPVLSQPFAPFGDLATYTPLGGGDMESGAAGWTLDGGAEVVDGNAPYSSGGSSLSLPDGSSAISAPLCIDPTFPFYRLFARNEGGSKSALKMEVLFLDSRGNVVSAKPTNYVSRSKLWMPTVSAQINVFGGKSNVSAAPVAFRFTPQGRGGGWQIDDVWVDPYARR